MVGVGGTYLSVEERYPMPTVPRVVTDSEGYEWKVVPGIGLVARRVPDSHGDWSLEIIPFGRENVFPFVSVERIALWTDLLANPTERHVAVESPA